MSLKMHIDAGMIQIGDSFGDQHYLPYAIGLLQAYAQSRLATPDQVNFRLPIYRRIPPETAVEQLVGSHILFFSVYIWNHSLSSEIARRYRKVNPDAVIVFGGPQVPENRQRLEHFMETHPFIDLACFTEGEEPFLRILEQFESRSWKEVPGVAFRSRNGVIITSPSPPLDDLDLIPSPYLLHVFDPLMKQNLAAKWSALMESNRGCPFTCAFCYWGTGDRQRIRTYSLDRVYAEIDWFAQNEIEFIFCCDANFGILDRDMGIVERVANIKGSSGYPCAFSVQSTKNSTAKIFDLQKRLNDAGLQKGVNLALQSLYRPTLEAIARSNITTETYGELLTLFNKADIPAFSDLILGLPEESYETYTQGIEQIVHQGQHNRIQFINLTILENTAMADPSYIERFGLYLVESKIVSHHTSLTESGNVSESQRLVVGTYAMPNEDWVKARIFSWIMSLFYFDRLLQIPLILLVRLAGVGVRELAEHIITAGAELPTMATVLSFMHQQAREIQNGNPEFVPSIDFLDIWWPTDEFLFIHHMREGTFDQLYTEAADLLVPYESRLPEQLLNEALRLNRALIKEPFVRSDLEIELSYPIPELYASFQKGENMTPSKGCYRYLIDRSSQHWTDWDTWMREMVWYSGKKSDYLYPLKTRNEGYSV